MTKYYKVVSAKDMRTVWKSSFKESDCIAYLESNELSDHMSTVELTIIPVWTNQNPDLIDLE